MSENEKSKELAKVEPGELTELERKTLFVEQVKDAYMMDVECQEGLEPGHSVRVRAKRDKETGEKTLLAVGRPDDLDEITGILSEGGYTVDAASVTDKSIERAREKFPFLYSLAERLGLPAPATEVEVEKVAEAAKSAPFAELKAAAAAVNNEKQDGEKNGETTS